MKKSLENAANGDVLFMDREKSRTGVGHVAMVVEDPKTKEKFVSESAGSSGVRKVPLQDWLRMQKKRGNNFELIGKYKDNTASVAATEAKFAEAKKINGIAAYNPNTNFNTNRVNFDNITSLDNSAVITRAKDQSIINNDQILSSNDLHGVGQAKPVIVNNMNSMSNTSGGNGGNHPIIVYNPDDSVLYCGGFNPRI